jgi:probable phosphoglycerate mutase
MSKTGNLVLIRHGQTAWSRDNFYTGRTNLPLTPEGMDEAREAQKKLQGINPEIIYVSPLKRAQQTAKLLGLTSYIIEPLIQEIDFGPVEGWNVEEITEAKTRYWGEYKGQWSVFSDGVFFDTSFLGAHPEERLVYDSDIEQHVKVATSPGETIQEAAGRAQRMIYKVLPDLYKGKDVVIVAHAQFLRYFATQWIEVHPKVAQNLFLNTASVSICKLTSRGEKIIYKWNE